MRALEKICYWIVGVILAFLGGGSLVFCIQNPESVTSVNIFASIVLTIGGAIFLVTASIFTFTKQ